MNALDLSNSVNGMGSNDDSLNDQHEESVFSKQFQSPGTFSFGPMNQSPIQDSEVPQVSDMAQIFNTKHVFESLSNETMNRPFLGSHAASPVRQASKVGCQAFNSALFIDFAEANQQHGAVTSANSPVNGQIQARIQPKLFSNACKKFEGLQGNEMVNGPDSPKSQMSEER